MHARHALEQRIAEIAARQHGLITRAQLLEAGMSPDTVRSRVRSRRLQPVHGGVYQIGPLTTAHAREMAAALACGRGAVVSHRSAAALWQLGVSIAKEEPIDVTMTGADRGCRPGIRAHRVIHLPAGEVAVLENIPITTLPRTLLDFAAVATSSELTQAFAVAARTHDLQPESVLALLSRYQRRPGAKLLRAVLADGTPALTRSQAEEQLLGLIRKAQLPRPEANAHIDRYEVDFLWKTQRLIVEVDGFVYHSSRTRFENDRRRDAALAAQGFRVMRLTWRQISSEPEATLVRLAQALAPSAV